MARPIPTDFNAPIDYPGIRRSYQIARIVAAVGVMALGLSGLVWDVPQAALLLPAGAAGVLHASYRLHRPGLSGLTSLVVDTTIIGLMLLVADLPQAQFAVAAFLLTASMLMLPLTEAALVVSYGALWTAIVANFAPIGVPLPSTDGGVTLGRAAGVIFLALIAALLFSASRVTSAWRRRQTEALELERRASRLKNQFVSMVSHEFRTPLTSIAGFTEMLLERRDTLSESETDEFLAIVHKEAKHLSNLVEDVLVIPRLEAERMPFEPEDFPLLTAAEAVVDVIFPHGCPIQADIAIGSNALVHADPHRVAQVLRNLLQNARKYGGDQILIEAKPTADLYQITVVDNGPGVPDEHRARIFEHFEQVSRGDARTDRGIGLGLPIARRLVEAMGGTLWHEPRFPTGSRFCFTLPAAESGAAALDESAVA